MQSQQAVEAQVQQGQRIAEVLNLRPIGGLRGTRYGAMYHTQWGTKTPFGLVETLRALLNNHQEG